MKTFKQYIKESLDSEIFEQLGAQLNGKTVDTLHPVSVSGKGIKIEGMAYSPSKVKYRFVLIVEKKNKFDVYHSEPKKLSSTDAVIESDFNLYTGLKKAFKTKKPVKLSKVQEG